MSFNNPFNAANSVKADPDRDQDAAARDWLEGHYEFLYSMSDSDVHEIFMHIRQYLEELERDLPALQPKIAEIKTEKGIESPLEIFPTAPASEDDIW